MRARKGETDKPKSRDNLSSDARVARSEQKIGRVVELTSAKEKRTVRERKRQLIAINYRRGVGGALKIGGNGYFKQKPGPGIVSDRE